MQQSSPAGTKNFRSSRHWDYMACPQTLWLPGRSCMCLCIKTGVSLIERRAASAAATGLW